MELSYTSYSYCLIPRFHARLIRILRRLSELVSGFRNSEDCLMKMVAGCGSDYYNSGLKADDEAYFLELTERYGQLVNRICLSYADSGADFDDLRQDVWINVWKSLDGFREDSSIDTWIYRITLNTCVSCLRKRKRSVLTSPIDGIFPEPADDVESDSLRERIRVLHGLISRLSPLDKAIMTMHLDGRSNTEIAEVTGLTKGNVATRLSRVKSRLSSEINSK
jgi:RNA polymerase sigma-70 factor (ECF subfamily)